MYTSINFKTKKALKQAVANYLVYMSALERATAAKDPNRQQTALREAGLKEVPCEVRIYSPGLGTAKTDGDELVEGPHFPKPHTWYAKVEMKDGVVINVK